MLPVNVSAFQRIFQLMLMSLLFIFFIFFTESPAWPNQQEMPDMKDMPGMNHKDMHEPTTPEDPAVVAKRLADKRESEFNHHLAGLLVALAGLFVLGRTSLRRAGRLCAMRGQRVSWQRGFFFLSSAIRRFGHLVLRLHGTRLLTTWRIFSTSFFRSCFWLSGTLNSKGHAADSRQHGRHGFFRSWVWREQFFCCFMFTAGICGRLAPWSPWTHSK